MARYILIDNCSGFIWADSADRQWSEFKGGVIEFAAAVDASNGAHDRQYVNVGRHTLASNETGYHVYRVGGRGKLPISIVGDGQDRALIDLVETYGEYETALRVVEKGEGA